MFVKPRIHASAVCRPDLQISRRECCNFSAGVPFHYGQFFRTWQLFSGVAVSAEASWRCSQTSRPCKRDFKASVPPFRNYCSVSSSPLVSRKARELPERFKKHLRMKINKECEQTLGDNKLSYVEKLSYLEVSSLHS